MCNKQKSQGIRDGQILMSMQKNKTVQRLRRETEAVHSAGECIDDAIGAFIGAIGFEFWDQVLSLNTEEEMRFVLELGEDEPLPMDRLERKELLDQMRRHHAECSYCQDRTRLEVRLSNEINHIIRPHIAEAK